MRGFIAVAESDRSVGEVLNVGSGYEISVGKLAKRISELMGSRIEIVSDDKRIRPSKSEVERLCCDASRLKKLTGWAPDRGGKAGLDQGLMKTIEWFAQKQNLDRYKADIYNL